MVGTPSTRVTNQHEESDDEIPPSVLNLDRRRRQRQHPPSLVQQEMRPQKSLKSPTSHSPSSSDDDDVIGSQCRPHSASFSGRKRIGLGFDTVQAQKKSQKRLGQCRAMKSFFDGSVDNGVGRPPRPPNNDSSNRHQEDDKALKQQQREEFAMLLQTSNNYKHATTNQHGKVPRHRRTPTLFRPTVAEDAHSSCHASSDETSNEELPWVRKKKCSSSIIQRSSGNASQLLDSTTDQSANRNNKRSKTTPTAIRSTRPNARQHRRHRLELEDERGYSSISSVDDDDEALLPGSSALRRRPKPAAVLQLESRNRHCGRRKKEVS